MGKQGLDVRIFHAEVALSILGGQLDKESRTTAEISNQGQVQVSKAKLHQGLRSVARDPRKLAEENQLNAEPPNLERHLCCS